MNIFLAAYFFGKEMVSTTWLETSLRNHQENVFEFRVISAIYYGLSNDYRCQFSFIHHLLVKFFVIIVPAFGPEIVDTIKRLNWIELLWLMMSFSFFKTRWSTQISRHRSSHWGKIGLSCQINHLNKHSMWDEWQDKVSFCSLIRFNWRVTAIVP